MNDESELQEKRIAVLAEDNYEDLAVVPAATFAPCYSASIQSVA